jgi:hypothetical protein
MTSPRRFPPPWQGEQTPGGFKVLDASGQAETVGCHRKMSATKRESERCGLSRTRSVRRVGVLLRPHAAIHPLSPITTRRFPSL